MGLLGVIRLSIALVSLTQIPFSKADCPITSAVSVGPSSILVKWNSYLATANYILDLRITDDKNTAPVIVVAYAPQVEKRVHGLQPGKNYTVTLKVLEFMTVSCTSKIASSTVPDTAQFTSGVVLSSSSISLKWTNVESADHYYLVVFSQSGTKLNLTQTTTSAVVDALKPSTNFDCYVYTANRAGVGFPSKVRTLTTLVQPPDNITAVQTGRSEAKVSWDPVDDVLMYLVRIREADDPAAAHRRYNVTNTQIHLDQIQPCSEYLIQISSYNMFLVPSEPRDFLYMTNTLNPVQTVSVDYACDTGSVTVWWMPVQGADSYKAQAVTPGEASLLCTGTFSSCIITGVSCGRTYEVHVTPISDNCENQVNSTFAIFHSVPCPPENLLLERSCDSEVILFSWANSSNSNLYKAKAIDSKGEVLECLTEDNSCYFTQTHCGRHYYFSVYSMSGTCHSQSSPTVDISTAPCMPKNPLTSADCHTDAMVSKWDLAEGAVNYTVEAYGNEANNSYHLCTTHSNSCSFQNLTCGSSFTIYITAHDQYCSSPRMLAPVANAVPCTPVNVIVSTDCEANSIAVNWNIAPGAIVYRASAVDDQGNVYSCYTLDLTCTIDNLHCSTNYSVSVFASNLICNSSISDTVRIETVACAPSNITSTLDCANNEALITWTAEPRMKSFTATALDQNNRLLSCSSTTTSCTISDLECDQRYSVTVGNHDGICPTINSETVNMDSMACGPSVAADMDCGSQVLMASWEAVADAEGYEVQLSDGTVQKNFSITNPAFTSNNLLCGKTYTLNVRSVIDGCVTHATQVTASQAPCPPTSVEALAACPQTSANVTWQTSEGALSYEVTAVSSSGAQLQCNSTGTSCQLGQLLCGETYSITATALDGQCESQSSAPTQLTTEPCAPSSLAVSVDCASNSALLSWHSSPNAASYAGTGVSESGHTVSCAAGPDLSCSLDQLQCGEEYRFTVTASDGTCQSAESQAVLQSTAPCAVTSVSHTVECTSDSLLTSWTPAQSALNYTVRAENVDDGSVLSCKTEQSGCVLDGLPCGEQYTVTVTPSSSSCVGQSSEAQRVNTAPCVPSNIVAEIQCSDNSLHSSWDKVPGATSYLATLSGDGGFYQECPSRVGFCSFSSLECAQSFTLNVTGENDRCNSSATLDVQSAPCDPTDVTASLDCVSGVALVSWTASAGALSYTVLAQSNNHEARCGTDTTSCELPSLICGEAYAVIVLAADNTCNSSVLTTLTITTAPCPPVLQDFSLDCTTNVAVVPWVKDEDAQSVLVSAVSSLGHSTTCSSDNSSCVLSDLQCGNSYTVTAVAKGVQCKSKPSAPLTITTAPCTPENIDFTNSCETGIAIVTWDDSLGRESFRVSATSATDVKTCLSDSTDCSISSMLCGQLYNVSVYAIAAHCNSSVPAFTQIQTAPCAPEDVAVSLLCDNNTGSVSWSPSPGAVSYTVKALGRSGQAPLTCSSDNTSCDIPNMQCGETYRFTVTPFSLECQGYDSREMEYLAGPCPPSDFTVDRQCSGNVAVVSWNPVPKAEYYEASALELVTPHTHNCSSSSTTCSITDLHCGETVAITVQTRERGCWSQPNQAFLFEAVICPPTGLTAVTNCSNNDITVSWDSSPKLGVTYYVDSAQLGASSQQFSSSSTSHVITGLQCGQLYTLQVSAQYQECTSAPSSTIQAQTAPCPPTGLEASTDCGTSSVTLSWTQSSRATDYTATFTGANGDVTSCSSNSSSCTARLDCSQQYTAALTASDDACSSSIPATLIFNSAPCLPDNVVATLDCDTNSFSVSWDGNLQDGPFTAQAIGSDGSRVSCSSALNSCSMNSLKCGLQYSIVVTTADVDCGEITDSNYKAYSAPCKPEAISLDLDCLTNEALVTWEGTGPDQEQEVIARDIRGNTISCISNTTQCAFTGLTCGLSYSISVVGRANTCTSTPTHGPMLHTAPCLPSQVKTTFDCATGVTIVTWDAANGATSYIVEAQGNLGHSEQCTGADSNCAFASLACGQDYNITVQAQNSECTSAVSETVQSATGPCPHSGVGTTLDCLANIAVVSWSPGSGILYYNASASGLNVASTESCATNQSSCNITTMRCGESYSVSVTGQGYICTSPPPPWKRLTAAPCPPTLLSVDSSSNSSDVVVTWQPSKGASSYLAVAQNEAGRSWSCESLDTKCQINDLPCGQTFSVYVSGRNGDCVGGRSNQEIIQTAPCVPQNITTSLNCPTGSLNVSWDILGTMPRSIEFYVINKTGTVIYCVDIGCPPAMRTCIVPNQPCGQSYDVALKSVGATRNSSRSAPHPVTTAPCPVKSFDTVVDCSSGAVSVSWQDGVEGALYQVSAEGPDGEHVCSSSAGGCDLDALQCGSNYSVTITPSQDGCVGARSAPQTVTTVPCVPQLNEVEVDCLTTAVWVTGAQSAGAQDYLITVTDSVGGVQTFQCDSILENMCFLPPLACSRDFSFSVQARDSQCSSAYSNAMEAETGPCSPVGIISKADCNQNVVSISWDSVPGAVSYTATLEDFAGKTDCCTSSNNTCDISGLPCGHMYVLLVTAEGRACNSSESREMARTAPCVPEKLDYSLSCSSNVASLSWNHSLGGQLYRVSALSQDNYTDQCSSHENRCDLSQLQCGQTYTVNVAAEDMDCSSRPSQSVSIKTIPCTPQDLSSSVDCGDRSLMVSWTDSAGADSYIARVEDSYGQSTSCQATTEGQCSLNGLGCGNIYHVTLVASDGYCNSQPTDMVDTPSAPCQPERLSAVLDCGQSSALVSWYPSDGALFYIVTAVADSGHVSVCRTDDSTYCSLEQLECGDSYSIQVLAVGEACNTTADMSGVLDTDPCVPEILSTDYSLSIGQVLWASTAGADYYTVEAVTDQGLSSQCETNDTYCALYDIQCSQTYRVSLTARSHSQCSEGVQSNQSSSITSEPCPPQEVQVSVKCQTNMGVISWEPSVGARAYEAKLSGRNGQILQCYTEETFCHVEGLACGTVYYVEVIAVGDRLNSSGSDTATLHSAPCPVENVMADLDCYNNSAAVSWSPASGATSYEIIATAVSGQRVSCVGNETECELEALECGETYSIQAVSRSEACGVEMDTGVTVQTRPCNPQHVAVDLDCGAATASVFWEDVDGVDKYNATAVSSEGVTSYCSSAISPCLFSDLQCGQSYTFYVEASSDLCFSEPSETAEAQTGPCQPSGLEVLGSCNNNTVEVGWSPASGAEWYTVYVSGDLGYTLSLRTDDTVTTAELPCGQMYNFSVRAHDSTCSSVISNFVEMQRSPCMPVAVQSYIACEDSIGGVSWGPADGAEYYIAFAVGLNGSSEVCTTNETWCQWDDLSCGDFYTVYVTAHNGECDSAESNETTIRTASCIPQNLVSTFNCSLKVGELSWDAVTTADYYIATAESNSGHRMQVSTNDTWAFFSEFSCGEEYFLSVQSVDDHCTSKHSPTSKLQSEPCPPMGVSSFMNCVANIAVVSWNSSAGADYYTATVTSEEGTSHTCWSDGEEQCGIPNLRCGHNYSVSVVASNKACNSEPSQEGQLKSTPCVPTDVQVMMDCGDNSALVSWSASEGALRYTVMAQGSNGSVSSCETAGLSCTLADLQCGQQYSVQVVARDEICASLPSPATSFPSVPCTPDMGSVAIDCGTDTFLADWLFSEGAENYTVTALSANGDVSSCSSSYPTNCELSSLKCGQLYNVSVAATNRLCSSPPSDGVQAYSAPCPSQGLSCSLNCLSNTISVGWQQSTDVDFYQVEALGVEEDTASCTSTSDSCVLDELRCGFTYNISLTAYNPVCNVSSPVIQQLSVPCVPQNVRAELDCETRDVQVTWQTTKGALSYRTVAQSAGGFIEVCNSSVTWCSFTQLACDMNYTFTVVASDDQCSSHASDAVELYTGPCDPQSVMASIVCENNTGLVSWEEADGVSSYSVHGHGPDGHAPSCITEGTSCRLDNMHCGQTYNLTVTANDGTCDNSQSHLTLDSAPCSPTNVGVSFLCASRTGAVTWEQASGASSYTATAVSADGSHTSTCTNNQTYCDLSDLQCGTLYSVSVRASHGSCSSGESAADTVRTAPCPPEDVQVTEQCAAESMTVSWTPNPDADYFTVAGLSSSGERLSCNTTAVSCLFSSLPCGQTYRINVTTHRNNCPSTASNTLTTSSAPCVPTDIRGNLDCVTNSAWISWTESEGATVYSVLAQAVGTEHNSSCSSTTSPCSAPDLLCGTLYNIKLTAQNQYCSSRPAASFQLETAPCALTSIDALTQCDSSVITVQWQMSENTPVYVVTAEGHDMSLILCNSTTDSCQLQDAKCGMQYSVIVSTSSDKCSSRRSPPTKVHTAPCAPQNVTAVQVCGAGGLAVSWDLSHVASDYRVEVTGEDFSDTCNTSFGNCTLSALPCGADFQVVVYALTQNCTSPGTTVTYTSGPCPPSGLTLAYDCESLSAALSWDSSEGAARYFVSAQTGQDTPQYCSSTGLSCTISDLVCGHNYSFIVEASDNVCNSSFGTPIVAGAVPCAPEGIMVRMQLMEGRFWAMISWEPVSCQPVEYQVIIVGHINDDVQTQMHMTSYWHERPYYETPVPDSSTYKINVYARNAAGVSDPSYTKTGSTVPATPTNVVYNQLTSELSWDASVLADYYSASTVDGVGLCETALLSCIATADPADIRLTASNSAGRSLPAAPTVQARRRRALFDMDINTDQKLSSPTVVSTSLHNTSLTVTWTPVDRAAEYVVMVTRHNGQPRTHNVYAPQTELSVNGLRRNTQYCLQVAAKNNLSQSAYSKPPTCTST